MAHTVVKIGKMASNNVDAYLRSVQNTVDMDNGSHVVLGDPIPGNPEVLACSAPTDVTTQEVLLVESPVIVEINGYRIGIDDPREFVNPANRPARARHLKVGDEITITVDGITGTPTVGQYAVPANGSYKLAAAADLTGNTVVAYQIVAQTTLSIGQEKVTAYKLRVVKAR